MDKRTLPQWTVSGIVEAPVEAVWLDLITHDSYLSTAQKNAILRQGEPLSTAIGKFGEGQISIEVDPGKHSVALQGEWWYRGVTSVEPHPPGCRMTYAVYNIAPGLGWWLAQKMQGPQAVSGMKEQFRARLEALGVRLGCRARLE